MTFRQMRKQIWAELPPECRGLVGFLGLWGLLRRAAEQVPRLPEPFAVEYLGNHSLLLSWGKPLPGRSVDLTVQSQPNGTFEGSVVRCQPGAYADGEAFSQRPLRRAEHWHWVLYGDGP